MIEGVKAHVVRHKFIYGVGVGVVISGVTFAILRSSRIQGGPMNNASFSFMFKSPQTMNVATVLDKGGRGHPGWPVWNEEYKLPFFSQKAAAEAFDIPEGILSGHLNGKFPSANGLHFKRMNLVIPE